MPNSLKSRGIREAGAVVAAVLWGALMISQPWPAAAGEVHVEGSTVVFKAKLGEVNTVVVNPAGSVLDSGTGQFLRGFTVVDTTSSLSVGPGCRRISGTALCEVQNGVMVADLRDKDDKITQPSIVDDGRPVSMTVQGGPGDDTLTGGDNDDVLDGGPGKDVITGGRGNDVLKGGIGDDVLDGGGGNDEIHGELGDDRIDAGVGNSKIFGGPGKDIIDSRNQSNGDIVDCGTGRDTLTRDAGDTVKHCE